MTVMRTTADAHNRPGEKKDKRPDMYSIEWYLENAKKNKGQGKPERTELPISYMMLLLTILGSTAALLLTR